MLRKYPPNRMLSILVILLAMATYFSFDLYNRGKSPYSRNGFEKGYNTLPTSPAIDKASQNSPSASNTQVEGNRPENDIIQPGAVLITRKIFTTCAHTEETKIPIPEDLVNLTKNDLIYAYKDWTIEKFAPHEIIISKKINSKCRNHFILRDKDGFVAVYYQEAINGILLKEVTPLRTNNLPQKEMFRIQEGIMIESQQELAQILEDLGS